MTMDTVVLFLKSEYLDILVVVSVFFASFIQGILGFGFGMIAIPAMSLVMGPKVAIPIAVILGFCINVGLSIKLWKSISVRRFLPLISAGCLTVPLGSYLLVVLNPSFVKLILGLIILVTSVAYFFGFKLVIKNERNGLYITGLMSGCLSGVIGIGGPPIILFLANQNEDKLSFKANLVFYFFILGLIIIPSYMVSGLMSPEIYESSFKLWIPVFFGMISGNYTSSFVSQNVFKKMVLICLTASAIVLIWGQVF
ncbi:sulfite exporter TauE/SafE family protein [bacterium]|jgi:uncharacterized protein|nr:sulfite exporter TauE/SafE family protein [bacterium]